MGSFCTAEPATSTTETESSQQYTPAAIQQMQDLWQQVWQAGQTPFTPYTEPMVADINATQQGGINQITGAPSYLDAAQGFVNQGAAPISDADIARYYNPYQRDVIDATRRNFAENNAQQQNQIVGNAALKNALGGNRVSVAQAEAARQQKLAQDPVIAQMEQQGFLQALQAAQADRAAQAQAGYQTGALHNAALAGGQAQIGAGSLLQGNQQQQLNAAFQEFLRAQMFPYQNAQFLTSTGLPVLSAMGGSQTGSSSSNTVSQPAGQSPLQTAVGLGTTAAGLMGGNPFAFLGGMGSLGAGQMGPGMGGSSYSIGYGGQNVPVFRRGGAVRPRYRTGGFVHRVAELRQAMRRGGAIRMPSYAAGGYVYNNDEPSPLDPPSGMDRDLAIRTILEEAANQGPRGMQAVAGVIRNRAVDGAFGGGSPTGVVTAPKQFEPWNTPAGRARIMAHDPNSPAYAAAGEALDRAYTGDDPTRGATHFYSPSAQAALGRQAPAWDDGSGEDIGDHRFFRLPGGPGSSGGLRVTDASAQGRTLNPLLNPLMRQTPAEAPAGGLSEEARMALIAAGLGILASKNPHALGAIGEGGLVGIKQYTTGRQTKAKNELAARKLLQDAEQFAQGLDVRKKTLAESKRYHDILSEDRRDALRERERAAKERSEDRRDAAARTAYPGEGLDENGQTVKGLYQFNPETREYDFKPGKVIHKGATGGTREGQTERLISELRKENPKLTYQEALALTKRAPNADQATLRRESLALSAAKADIEYLRDPRGTLEKWRKEYGLPGAATVPADEVAPAAPSAPAAPPPPAAPGKSGALKPMPAEALAKAKAAIDAGKDRKAVEQRMREWAKKNGFEFSGL